MGNGHGSDAGAHQATTSPDRRDRTTAFHDMLSHARDVIASGDRDGALRLLLELATWRRGSAVELSELAADALIATAHAARDESDRRALNTYRQAQIAVDEILALVREAPLAADGLDRIRVALNQRQAQDRGTYEVAFDTLRNEARHVTSSDEAAVDGSTHARTGVDRGAVRARSRDGPHERPVPLPALARSWPQADALSRQGGSRVSCRRVVVLSSLCADSAWHLQRAAQAGRALVKTCTTAGMTAVASARSMSVARRQGHEWSAVLRRMPAAANGGFPSTKGAELRTPRGVADVQLFFACPPPLLSL